MTDAIAAARRIVAARGNSLDHLEGLWIEKDAVTVARALLALTDAKDDLQELWDIAGRATAGEWMVTSCLDYWVRPAGTLNDDDFVGIAQCGSIDWPDFDAKQPQWENNARHIAAFNPTVAQRLIARVRAAEKVNDQQQVK